MVVPGMRGVDRFRLSALPFATALRFDNGIVWF